MTNSIWQAMADLPETSVTVYALQGLDFVVPNQWQNIVGLENMVRAVTNENDAGQIQRIATEAEELFGAENSGYQQALWIYQTVDTADTALGAAALANKVSEKISFLSFLNKLVPKADTTQTVDLGIKVVAELVAFAIVRGIPRDRAAIGQFATALSNQYSSESFMRMAALVCIDGLLPLGPDFTRKAGQALGNLNPSQLENNGMYQRIRELIPGDTAAGQLDFINQSFEAVQTWMDNLMQSQNITTDKVLDGLSTYINLADEGLDYIAAFLDMSTNYFAHTGTQSVAHRLVQKVA